MVASPSSIPAMHDRLPGGGVVVERQPDAGRRHGDYLLVEAEFLDSHGVSLSLSAHLH